MKVIKEGSASRVVLSDGMIEKLKNINWDIIDHELNWNLPQNSEEQHVTLGSKQVEDVPKPSKKAKVNHKKLDNKVV